MLIRIHRGTHQIGGVVTEIATDNAKVFIDLGANLPGNDTPLPEIDGLICGDGSHSALFITHYHGDHIGSLGLALPDIPVYMGETAKEIQLIKSRRLAKVSDDEQQLLPRYEAINCFKAPEPVEHFDIKITPLFVDHSAFDAYMFIIEADGIRVLHTGDFRSHGMRSKALPKVLRAYAKNIDYIISEGTMLSRGETQPLSEFDLGVKAQKLIHGKKNVFVLCSSTNIDRIAILYQASIKDNPKRMVAVDGYQKDILNAVEQRHAKFSDFYRFDKAWPWYPKYAEKLENDGIFAFVRANSHEGSYKTWSEQVLERYFNPEDSLLIYSLWDGYLKDGINKNEAYCKMLVSYKPNTLLHTSGHASTDALVDLYNTVKPKRGLIPIHSEMPEVFSELLPNEPIVFLADGETLEVNVL
jgi:ribonuclease J